MCGMLLLRHKRRTLRLNTRGLQSPHPFLWSRRVTSWVSTASQSSHRLSLTPTFCVLSRWTDDASTSFLFLQAVLHGTPIPITFWITFYAVNCLAFNANVPSHCNGIMYEDARCEAHSSTSFCVSCASRLPVSNKTPEYQTEGARTLPTFLLIHDN